MPPVLPTGTPAATGEFQRKVIEMLEENSRETKRVSAMLVQVLEQLKTNAFENIVRACDFDQIPVSTELELAGLNALLTDDRQLFVKMVNYLAVQGGSKSLDVTADQIFKLVVAHDLAKRLNWRGTERKASIKGYKVLLELFVAAVKKNPFTSSATHTDVMDRLKIWLRKSSDRNGGRALRGAKKIAATAEQIPGPSHDV